MLEKVEVSVEELVYHEEDQEVGWEKAGEQAPKYRSKNF